MKKKHENYLSQMPLRALPLQVPPGILVSKPNRLRTLKGDMHGPTLCLLVQCNDLRQFLPNVQFGHNALSLRGPQSPFQ